MFGGGCVSSELLLKQFLKKKNLNLNKAGSKINWKTCTAPPGDHGSVQLSPEAARVCQSLAGAV